MDDSRTVEAPPIASANPLGRFLTQRDGFDLPDEAFSVWGTLGIALAAVAVMLITIVVVAIGFVFHNGLAYLQTEKNTVGIYAQLISYLTFVPFVVWAIPALAKRPLGDFVFRQVPLKSAVVAGVAGAVIMAFLVDGLGSLVDAIFGKHEQDVIQMLHQLGHNVPMTAAFIVMGVIGAPIAEELFFRGLIFNALYKRYSLWLSATISGLLFGLAHADLRLFVPLWLGGIVLAFIYARYRNLWVNISAHCLFNAIGITMAMVFK